jgi:hypothetical protein
MFIIFLRLCERCMGPFKTKVKAIHQNINLILNGRTIFISVIRRFVRDAIIHTITKKF